MSLSKEQKIEFATWVCENKPHLYKRFLNGQELAKAVAKGEKIADEKRLKEKKKAEAVAKSKADKNKEAADNAAKSGVIEGKKKKK